MKAPTKIHTLLKIHPTSAITIKSPPTTVIDLLPKTSKTTKYPLPADLQRPSMSVVHRKKGIPAKFKTRLPVKTP